MKPRLFCLLLLIFTLTGCAVFSKKTPPPAPWVSLVCVMNEDVLVEPMAKFIKAHNGFYELKTQEDKTIYVPVNFCFIHFLKAPLLKKTQFEISI